MNMTTGAGINPMEMCIANTWTSYNITTMHGTIILKGVTPGSASGADSFTGSKLESCDASSSSDALRCSGFGVASCIIKPYVRFYNTSISNGQLDEQFISQSELVNWGCSESFIDSKS
jgi:hypothetical protein